MAGYDWNYWRHLYVSGDDAISLEELRKRPNAPSIGSLKRRSTEESWPEQRKQFRNHAATVANQSATGVAAAQHVARLIDVAEIQARHIKLAKSMQSRVAASLQDMQQKNTTLSPRDAATWLKIATDLERLAVGLVTHRTEVVATDVTALTDEELQAIINEGASE
jgi:hypothetical protein